MISSEQVATAVVALLDGVWPNVGDTDPPPPSADPTTPQYAYVRPHGGPVADQGLGDGETMRWMRFRVTSVGVPSPGVPRRPEDPSLRSSAQWLADRLRAALLDLDRPLAGDGWRVTGRLPEATSPPVIEPGAVAVHEDFLLLVAASAAP